MENEKSLSNESADETRGTSRSIKRRARAGVGAKFAFYIHLAVFIAVNLLLVLINAMTTPLLWWAMWPIMGWGFALLIHALVSFLLPDLFGVRRRMYEKELARQKLK